MNKIVEILMRRDNMSQEDAEQLVKDTYAEIVDCTNVLDVDEIMKDNLGLEPDYIFDLLG